MNFLYFPDEINITKITGTGQVKGIKINTVGKCIDVELYRKQITLQQTKFGDLLIFLFLSVKREVVCSGFQKS